MRVAIIIFPGSNCDRDMAVAIERITGRRPQLVWHKQEQLEPVDLVIIPGGFSFGDYLRCGALAAHSPAMEAVQNHAARGGAVLGICNGFQVLLETGMLPGVLVKNRDLRFVCREAHLQTVANNNSPFTSGFGGADILTIPVAHNVGNYFADETVLAALEDNGQVALRYVPSPIEDQHNAHSYNPNGSTNDIAGITSPNGRVMGMMPHPERAIGDGLELQDGRRFLAAALDALGA